ncbi:hypothetical protein ACV3V0_19195, partial [Clostridium perfringens]
MRSQFSKPNLYKNNLLEGFSDQKKLKLKEPLELTVDVEDTISIENLKDRVILEYEQSSKIKQESLNDLLEVEIVPVDTSKINSDLVALAPG